MCAVLNPSHSSGRPMPQIERVPDPTTHPLSVGVGRLGVGAASDEGLGGGHILADVQGRIPVGVLWRTKKKKARRPIARDDSRSD